MRLRNVSIKVLACGALVALGMSVGSGAAHAALVEPTADQCKMFVQIAIDEGETFAFELAEHGLDASGCPAPPAPGVCVIGQAMDIDGDYDCSGTPQENEGDGIETPPPAEVCVIGHVLDIDGDYDCSGTPQENEGSETPAPAPAGTGCDSTGHDSAGVHCEVPTTTTTSTTEAKVADASANPSVAAVVKGVSVVNVVLPLSQAGLSAAAAPKAVPASALPVTGGDVMGIAMLAVAGLGIGGALLLVDKRRRTA